MQWMPIQKGSRIQPGLMDRRRERHHPSVPSSAARDVLASLEEVRPGYQSEELAKTQEV
jgi:hypothetical protein